MPLSPCEVARGRAMDACVKDLSCLPRSAKGFHLGWGCAPCLSKQPILAHSFIVTCLVHSWWRELLPPCVPPTTELLPLPQLLLPLQLAPQPQAQRRQQRPLRLQQAKRQQRQQGHWRTRWWGWCASVGCCTVMSVWRSRRWRGSCAGGSATEVLALGVAVCQGHRCWSWVQLVLSYCTTCQQQGLWKIGVRGCGVEVRCREAMVGG